MESILLLLLTLILGLSIILIIWWWNEIKYVNPIKRRYIDLKIPPGFLGFPFIGEILSFSWYFKIVRCPDDFIRRRIAKYGKNIGIYRSYLFGRPSIIACSPSTCKFILQSSNGEFVSAWSKSVVGDNSLIVLEGAHHHTIKRFIVNFVNRPQSLANIVLHIQPHFIHALQSWSKHAQITAFVESKKVTLETMRRYFIHNELGVTTDALVKLYIGVNKGVRAEPWNFYGTSYHHAIQCRKKIIKILKDEMERRKDDNYTTSNDLMDGLMQMKDEEGKSLSDEEVIDNVFLVTLVSHTTISYAIAWSLYFLAKSPHVLGQLRDENMSMHQKKKGEYITYEDALELKYTYKVVQEIIRMANISGILLRTATQDVTYKGYTIPKGWNVIVWLRYLHTDEENFENPLCFYPDRWNEHPKGGTYMPFGGGARTCAGNTVARLMLVVFIHYLSVGYQWKLINPDTPINYLSHPHLADGLQISITKL